MSFELEKVEQKSKALAANNFILQGLVTEGHGAQCVAALGHAHCEFLLCVPVETKRTTKWLRQSLLFGSCLIMMASGSRGVLISER